MNSATQQPAEKAKTAKEALLMAAELLSERGWCRGALARARNGRSVSAHSPLAASFCAYGAIIHVAKNDSIAGKAGDRLEQIIGSAILVDWNDRKRSAQPVIAALRKAAEL